MSKIVLTLRVIKTFKLSHTELNQLKRSNLEIDLVFGTIPQFILIVRKEYIHVIALSEF